MSIEYKLYSQIDDSGIQDACIAAAREHGLIKEMFGSGIIEAYIAVEDNAFIGAIIYYNIPFDDHYVRAHATQVEMQFRGRGIALNMWRSFLAQKKMEGYEGVLANRTNDAMISLFSKLRRVEPGYSYEIAQMKDMPSKIHFYEE